MLGRSTCTCSTPTSCTLLTSELQLRSRNYIDTPQPSPEHETTWKYPFVGGEEPRRQPIKFGDFVSLPGIDLLKKHAFKVEGEPHTVKQLLNTSFLSCRGSRAGGVSLVSSRHRSSLFLKRKLAGLSRRWLDRQGGMAISTGEIDVEDPTSRVRDTTYK